MSKKVGISTIHTTNNYGAVLQAYATAEFFCQNGYDAELIDYTNDHIQEQLKLSYKQDGKWKGYIITLIRNTLFGRLHYYKKAFKDVRKYYNMSQEYKTLDDLRDVEYDILVAGSDQLWNPVITKEMDPVFLLQFGNAKKRISVASSIGSSKLSDQDIEIMRNALKNFDAISVREAFAKEQLECLTEKNIKVLMDPTFLLNRDEWMKKVVYNSKYANTKEKYIVTYFAGGNKSSHRQIIGEYAKKFNLPVWTIQYSNYTWKESDKKILGATMEDFVALIANAALVITDSFHGVAFSLNMQSNFVALTNKANPVRVKALLGELGITERIDMPVEKYQDVKYSEVTPKLETLRTDSIKWVLQACEE